MEKIKKGSHSIRQAFMSSIAVTMLAVFLCSAATIYGCYLVQKRLLPDSDEVWVTTLTTKADGSVTEEKQRFRFGEQSPLTHVIVDGDEAETENAEYVIERIDSSYTMLSPKRRLLYQCMGACMVALPLLYTFIGIAACACWFYRKKIAPPVQILDRAARRIQDNDLDFEVRPAGKDELGRLCGAFEKMRQSLYENNRRMWEMLEQRRILQASVAHDLRNPIAILSGHVEYLQQNLPDGKLSGEKLSHMLSNMAATTKRMERYTDDIRDLHALEETELHDTSVVLLDYFSEIADSFTVMARQQNKQVSYSAHIPEGKAALDVEIVSRILENLFANALRYAREQISLRAEFLQNTLCITVTDDGDGFSKQMLNQKSALFYSENASGKHLGMGLATSRILCQKHGGALELSNITPHGACVKVTLRVKNEISSE